MTMGLGCLYLRILSVVARVGPSALGAIVGHDKKRLQRLQKFRSRLDQEPPATTALAFRIGILAPPALDDLVHNTPADSNLQRGAHSLFPGITEVRILSISEWPAKGVSERVSQ